LFSVKPDMIKKVKVETTIVDGKIVYSRNDSSIRMG
jgi:predicted amidohydrolase YtcJ